MTKRNIYTCEVVCYAEAFDFRGLTEALLASGRGACYRDVFYLDLEKGNCAIFPFGVAVYWNLPKEMIERLAEELKAFIVGVPQEEETDYYRYIVGSERTRFTHQHLELEDTKPLTLLAISHALAQSTKLSYFELQAEKTIEKTASIPRKMAETGSTSLSRKQAAKMRGQLFVTKSEIILKYGLLDTPEFFWEYPELQPIYDVGANYLELKQRTDVLSLKLTTIHDLFEMLSDDLKHQHSSMLEWIIIWLIAVEIVIFVVNDILLAQ